MITQQLPYIDAHQHFWRYDPAEHAWIGDNMSVIRNDFFPADVYPHMQRNNIEGCVAVQADQSEKETDFLLGLAKENDFIKGVVGWVDLCADNIEARLQHYADNECVKGFRHILQAEDPSFLLQPSFLHGISCLQKFSFSYDILITPQHMDAALELVKAFPHQRFVIDHIAKPDIKNKVMGDWEKGIRALAKYDHVHCKISGMVTEANWVQWTKNDLYPYLDVVTEAFGVDRLLYGSDWPVCLVAASYDEMIRPVRDYYSSFTIEEQNKIFRNNAIDFYQL